MIKTSSATSRPPPCCRQLFIVSQCYTYPHPHRHPHPHLISIRMPILEECNWLFPRFSRSSRWHKLEALLLGCWICDPPSQLLLPVSASGNCMCQQKSTCLRKSPTTYDVHLCFCGTRCIRAAVRLGVRNPRGWTPLQPSGRLASLKSSGPAALLSGAHSPQLEDARNSPEPEATLGFVHVGLLVHIVQLCTMEYCIVNFTGLCS